VLAGLPPHRFNKRVVADKERVVDVDFDGIPLFTEFDGWDGPRAPRGRIRYQQDIDRQNALVTRGRTPLRFTYADLVQRPAWVRETVIANGRRLARERGDPQAQAAWEAADPRVPQCEKRCQPAKSQSATPAARRSGSGR